MNQKITLYSYYSPEEITGIGKYNGEMIDFFLSKNLRVNSFSNVPFYPYWKKYEGFENAFYSKKTKGDLIDVRSKVYIPESPRAFKKIFSEISFLFSSSIALLLNLRNIKKSSLFLVVNPPFFIGVLPLVLGKILRVPVCFHVQDLQVDAAEELGLLPNWLCRFLRIIERTILKSADHVSTISVGMKEKIDRKNISREVLLVPNWSDLDEIIPGNSKWLHDYIQVEHFKKLIVYSGNVGEKQGLDIVLEAAKFLEEDSDIVFVILGAGLYLETLKEKAKLMGLSNLVISDLVPKANLNDMLQSSHIQLVVQKSAGADSFLPSKLTNIMSAGCACIITAEKGTGLYTLMKASNSALLVDPDDPKQMENGIRYLLENCKMYEQMKIEARIWAENNLAIDKCLSPIIDLIN
ncbi:WcaI family glycosyltransferase [Reichenbachiella ulvae]|uniref:WcaI family glycosyltransferase n=1 Tax=Reichenbachiella ulvae TaxID=2980104 RepID=A0ABT3CY71_9BACT|nr:WcaI family glycosyltransferase [Reichenbachiella ulvae]MCV9388493.1 WcaI family glycosyltransferase [Reichenbachiella ulvae]